MTQNIVVRLSWASLQAGDGFRALYGEDNLFSILGNVVLTF